MKISVTMWKVEEYFPLFIAMGFKRHLVILRLASWNFPHCLGLDGSIRGFARRRYLRFSLSQVEGRQFGVSAWRFQLTYFVSLAVMIFIPGLLGPQLKAFKVLGRWAWPLSLAVDVQEKIFIGQLNFRDHGAFRIPGRGLSQHRKRL